MLVAHISPSAVTLPDTHPVPDLLFGKPPRLVRRRRGSSTASARPSRRATQPADREGVCGLDQALRRYILFHGKRHPAEMGAPEVTQFLTSLAVDRRVAASTQNQALGALLFLYREVLDQSLPWLDDLVRGRRSEERRVGKECGLLCRSRWSPYH